MPQLKTSGRLPPPIPSSRARRSAVPRMPSLPAPAGSAASAPKRPAPAPTAKITALKPPAPPSQRSPAQRSPSQPPSSQPSRLRDLKTGEVLNLTDKAHEKTGISKVPPELAPTNEVPAVKATRPLTMLDAKELPMAPVRNEHYRALRALADELDAYLTEVERDKAWWREPRFVIVSEGEAVGVILQPRPKKKRR